MIASIGVTMASGLWALAIALGIGFAVRALAPRARPATRVALAFLVGATTLSYGVLGLGVLSRLRSPDLFLLLVVLSVPLAWHRRAIAADVKAMLFDAAADYRRSGALERAVLLVACGLTALSLAVPLLPVTNADALAYATAVPERFARDGAVRFYPDSYDSAFVLVVETLNTVGAVFHTRPTGPWFEVAAQILLFFAAADLYRALWGDAREGSAYLFGAVLLLSPLVQLMPMMAKGHLVELLAIVVCVTLVLDAPNRGGWAGAAAAAGVAAATKYTAGLGIAAMVAPLVFAVLWRSDRSRWRTRDLAAAFGVGLCLASPFYIRNFIFTGDPLFPTHRLFLTSPLTLQYHDEWLRRLSEVDAAFGHRPVDLLLWWLRAATLPIRESASYIGTFALAFLPLAFVRPRPPHAVALGAGVFIATVALFAAGSPFERYFIAPFAGMTALAVGGWQSQGERSRGVRVAGAVVLLATGVGLTLPLKAYGLIVHAPALVSADGEHQVLARTTPWYDDFTQVRAQLGPDQPVLCLLRNCQYLVNYRREDLLFRLAEPVRDDSRAIDPRPVWRGLHHAGVRHVMAFEPPDFGGSQSPASVVGWLARCGGRVVYRNPRARFGTRDPRRSASATVVLIELSDELSSAAAALEGSCGKPGSVW